MTDETLYLKCKPGDVKPLILLSGDPARVERVAALLDDAQTVSVNREFSVASGTYRGVGVSVVSGGIGAPSTAIAMEELAQLGAKAIVRVGTMMGINATLGSVVLPTGAARFEGTSRHYLPVTYPALPDWGLVHALAEAGWQAQLEVSLGPTATHDAFYPDMAASLIGQGSLDLAQHEQAGILSMDMETSLIFVMGTVRAIATAAMCLITVKAEPHTHLDTDRRTQLDERMVRAALDGLVAFGSK
jgi:uridine phosphorylase